jgi:hypothetical protein
MRIRTFTLLVVLAMLVAACSPAGTTDSTSTTGAEVTTTTGTPAPEPMELAYSLQSGTSYAFEVGLDQTIDLSTTGDASALGEGDVPGQMSVSVTGTSVFTYSVADGPESGTYAVTITGDFSDLQFTGTVDGEPVTADDIPDFANMEPVDVTVIVDEQGNVIPDQSGQEEDLFGMGGLDMLGQLGSTGATGQFVGPPFTEDEVTVGDTWSETVETPTMPGSDPITTKIESEVVSTDSVDGHDVFVIDTTTTTSPISFDLGDLLAGFMTAFVPEDASEEELAQLDEIVSQIKFAFSVDETVGHLKTWFDYEAGLARNAEYASTTHLVMDINMPDDTTNELVAFGMDMNVSQDVTYHLTDAPSA